MRLQRNSKKWAILNDLQIPWHHEKVVFKLVLPFLKTLKLDGVVLNGDIIDCYAISDWDKNPLNLNRWGITREIRVAGRLMHELRDVPVKIWLGGNHEDRWRRIEWRHPNLRGMLKNLPEALKMGDYGFVYSPYGSRYNLGKLTIEHGDLVRSQSAYTARGTFEKRGCSVMVGHTHRLGFHAKTNLAGVHGAWENGCLCRLDPEYVQNPDWQQGFSIVHVFDGGLFNVQQIPIIDQRVFMYGDRAYYL